MKLNKRWIEWTVYLCLLLLSLSGTYREKPANISWSHFLCFWNLLTSSVIYYWTDARKHRRPKYKFSALGSSFHFPVSSRKRWEQELKIRSSFFFKFLYLRSFSSTRFYALGELIRNPKVMTFKRSRLWSQRQPDLSWKPLEIFRSNDEFEDELKFSQIKLCS